MTNPLPYPYIVTTTRNPLYPTAKITALAFDNAADVALFLVRRNLAEYVVYKDGVRVAGLGGTARAMTKALERAQP